MNFICNKHEIDSALSPVAKILSSKPVIPALEGIYIEAENDCCRIVGGNGQLTVETTFKADIKEGGRELIPGKRFADIIRQCEGEEVSISSDTSLTITSDRTKTIITLMEADSYPMINLKGDSWEFEMNVNDFKNAVRGSSFCAAGENYYKPMLSGVFIEKEADVIKFVAIDGQRIAIHKTTAKGNDGKLLIPAKALDEISKSMGESESIKFTVYDNYAKIEFDDISISSTLLDADEYMDYNIFLPKDYKTKIKIERSKFVNAINRGIIVSKEKMDNLLILEIDDSVLTIKAKSDIGENSDELDILQEGEYIKIGLNGKYILDCLRGISDEYIFLEFNSPVDPCLIKPCEGNDFIYMICAIHI